MRRAVAKLEPQPDHVLIDGLPVQPFPIPQTALVGGDALSFSIAAASVIAKVTRDRHHGRDGRAASRLRFRPAQRLWHAATSRCTQQAWALSNPSPVFSPGSAGGTRPLTRATRSGGAGERLAEKYLRRHGYKILYRNFRAPGGGEVDLVCRDIAENTLVFVEVKTRTATRTAPRRSGESRRSRNSSPAARWRGCGCSTSRR